MKRDLTDSARKVSVSNIKNFMKPHAGPGRPARVYLIRADSVNAVKIGLSSDARVRLTHIQSHCPVPLTLAAVSPLLSKSAAHAVEKRLHRMLAEWHLHGEWFAWTGGSLNWLVQTKLFLKRGGRS